MKTFAWKTHAWRLLRRILTIALFAALYVVCFAIWIGYELYARAEERMLNA